MTMRRVIFAVLVALLVASCSKFDQQDALPEVEYGQLRACFAEQTRTYVEGERFLRWHERDELSVFYGNAINNKYRFNGKTGDSEGTFALIIDGSATGTNTPIDRIYALYPRDVSAEWVGNGSFRYNLPTEQYYLAESFGQNSNAMVAVTEGTSDDLLMFKNVCGYLKVQLYGDATVKSMTLKTNAGEKISGLAYVTAEYGKDPAVSMDGGGVNMITLSCGDGVVLSKEKQSPTDFWFVVPPTTFSEGITVTATDVNGKTFTKSTSSRFAIGRNALQPMEACECNLAQPETPEPEDPDAIKSFKITYRSEKGGKMMLAYQCTPRLENAEIVKIDFGDGTVEEINYLPSTHTYYVPGDYDVTIYYKGNPTRFINTYYDSPFVCEHYYDYSEWYEDCTPVVKIEYPASFVVDYSITHLEEVTYHSDNLPERLESFGSKYLRRVNSKYATEDGRMLIKEGVLLGCARGGDALDEYTIPEGVHTIAENCFYAVKNIKKINLPSTLKKIENNAFASTAIEQIALPASLTTIESNAFSWSALKSIEVPATVVNLGNSIFSNCKNLTKAVVHSDLVSEMFYRCDCLAEVEITKAIISIPDYCFRETALRSFNVPKSVTTIGKDALSYIDELQSVTFEAGSQLRAVEESAFMSCDTLTDIELPNSVVYIGAQAFEACNFTAFKLPDSLVTLGDSVFCDCKYLESITIPKSVQSIGLRAFDGAKALKSVLFEDGSQCKSLGSEVFSGCTALESVVLPDGL